MEKSREISSTANCKKCGGDIFRFRITIDEQGDVDWHPECVRCNGVEKPAHIEDLEEEVSSKQLIIHTLQAVILNFPNIIEEKGFNINDLEDDLNRWKEYISELEYELDTAKERISELESIIQDLQCENDRI